MKIALYIEDGLEQIVLTPETSIEKNILSKMHDENQKFHLKRGSFFKCQGGWMRYAKPVQVSTFGHDSYDDDSTMIILENATGNLEEE